MTRTPGASAAWHGNAAHPETAFPRGEVHETRLTLGGRRQRRKCRLFQRRASSFIQSSHSHTPLALAQGTSPCFSPSQPHAWPFGDNGTIGFAKQRRSPGRLAAVTSDSAAGPVAPSRPFDHVIEAQQFSPQTLKQIFAMADEMQSLAEGGHASTLLQGYLMATLFYEPSTRTRLSFESAMKRLGGETLTTENAREFSSAAKGETLADTIRTVEAYADIIVLRHYESGSARIAANVASVPIINAGDGPGQHPTQALLDIYTIQKEVGRLQDIRVGLVGDLANGRTARSLAYLLAKFPGVRITFVAPDVVRMKDDIKAYLTECSVPWEESEDLMEVAASCDVIYQTRIQRERFGERIDDYERARGKYIVDRRVMAAMQPHAVVLHPLPRLDEITTDVDTDPRAAYFRQARNGLYIRMALLKMLLLPQ